MNWAHLFRGAAFDVGCTVEVSHQFESLGANVVLDDDLEIYPGDRVRVHGNPIFVPYGHKVREQRTATVIRAPWWERLWIRATGDVEFQELIDVSFTDRRMV